MNERVALPPWESDPSARGFVLTWVSVTFRPKAFVAYLGGGASMARAALYAAIAVAFSMALIATVIAATTYPSLQRFGATDSFGRLFALQLGWYAGKIVCLLFAAAISTCLVALMAGRPPGDALRARMYTFGPLTWPIAWWVMFRWLERDSNTAWRTRFLALGGCIAELALAMALSPLLTGAIRDAVFTLFYPG